MVTYCVILGRVPRQNAGTFERAVFPFHLRPERSKVRACTAENLLQLEQLHCRAPAIPPRSRVRWSCCRHLRLPLHRLLAYCAQRSASERWHTYRARLRSEHRARRTAHRVRARPPRQYLLRDVTIQHPSSQKRREFSVKPGFRLG
jgi:hypothetical protein